jgi:hypothetical protein
MAIYSAPDYSLGNSSVVTASEKSKAEAAIRGMRKSLKQWITFRSLLNDQAAGLRPSKLPISVVRNMIATRDVALEQRMASRLHVLLSEMFDPSSLPNPNMQQNPQAAVELAQIAIAGKLSDDVVGPTDIGMVWLWPAVAVVGAVLVTVMFKIKSDADVLKDQAHNQCVMSGGCTDYGFWLKLGGVAAVAWLAWEKVGLREAAGRLRKRAS